MELCHVVVFVIPHSKYIMEHIYIHMCFIRFILCVYVSMSICVHVCRYVCLCDHGGRQKGTLDSLALQL